MRLGREGQWIGLENYRRLFGDASFAQANGFTALLTRERVLVVALVPPILALALNEFGRAVRIPLRLLFTIPFALLALGLIGLAAIAAAVWRFGWPFWLTLFIAIALCQLFYFDRLALVAGPTEPMTAEAVESPSDPAETAA